MRYLGLDVHDKSTVFCLLDASGTEVEHGRVPTSAPALEQLVKRLATEELKVGQEVGVLSYFVHDTVTATGVTILSFNAQHMGMIASSRKKTDRRDAYWIAKALQSGMMPHPVYIPTGAVRRLRGLLSQRDAIVTERKRWLLRARSYLRAAGGYTMPKASRTVKRLLALSVGATDGLDAHLAEALELCRRNESSLSQELRDIEKTIRIETRGVAAIERLKTIPAVGDQVATRIYAWVGDVTRFPNARSLASYAGLAPSVWQSGETTRHGGVTKQGSPPLRSVLVQAGHVLLFRCTDEDAAPLRAIAMRVHKTRAKRKIAVVAAARHILRVAFYVLRDHQNYNPALLRSASEDKQAVA
jgi:transposase